MATHRTRPKKIEEVIAIVVTNGLCETLLDGPHGDGTRKPGDYIVQVVTPGGRGDTFYMTREEFEAEYEAIPPQPLTRSFDPNRLLTSEPMAALPYNFGVK